MAGVFFVFFNMIYFVLLLTLITLCNANDILGCGGFVKSHVSLDYSKIEIGLYTKEGTLKEKTECAPTNGYYFLPLYEKGEYILKVHPPAGWSFEPSKVELLIDGVADQCSTGQDINFAFNGFGIAGKVITVGQNQGPSGISVQLVNDKGEVRDTITAAGGDFTFTPVIPGKYVVKASHPRWKLEPSQAVVQVKEGNTALPVGVLAVKGYDVKGSVTSFGHPIGGLYVVLYSKEESPKYRVEGCNTALLQGVPGSPICHSVTDTNGEFSFGLVPAGEYRLLALTKRPGQATISYNIRPETVPFTVRHDSLYIKNAFEVTGYTLVGTVLSAAGGSGIAAVQVSLDGEPAGATDAAGKYTLPALLPGDYTVSFRHEQCEVEDVALSIAGGGAVRLPAARAARWRVCGAVSPAAPASFAAPPPGAPPPRRVALAAAPGADGAGGAKLAVDVGADGKWCTFLRPGVYTAKVEVSDQELRDGLQYYPLSQQVVVRAAGVDGVSFSQLKAEVRGEVACLQAEACAGLRVRLRARAPSGDYQGPTLTALVQDGKYTFSDVLPGAIEVSVPAERLCWRDAARAALVAQARAELPPFRHVGYRLHVRLDTSADIQVEYSPVSGGGGGGGGTLTVSGGEAAGCVPAPGRYLLTPRGCHLLQPPTAHVDVSAAADRPPTVYFKAVAHAATVRVVAPDLVDDLTLRLELDGRGPELVGPLAATKQPDGEYLYEHTLYLAEGEVAVVSARSSRLLFSPAAPAQVVGRAACQPEAARLRARRALLLQGRIRPPVAGVTVTLTGEGVSLSQTTGADGLYRFGPLDAARPYAVRAHKESYAFGERDAHGDIAAHKLAEINVLLLDKDTDQPLQGGVVSVSGGSYRRNLAAGAEGGGGALRFPSLAPAQYYVKPLMKEYRFEPPHLLVDVHEGRAHPVTLRGVRVAWSCSGRLVSLGGQGWAGAALSALPQAPHHAPAPAPAPPRCAPEEATTDAAGAFRIRGLLPDCVYTLHLKDSSNPELAGLKLVQAPETLEVTDKKDIEKVRLIAVQGAQVTDGNVLVYTPVADHYRTLRLTLTLEAAPGAPLYSAKLDAAGYSSDNNPGVMHALPRLPADNRSYVLQLDSSLSKATHSYEEEVLYFHSDGKFKSFDLHFLPKVVASEQELRHSSLLLLPALGLAALALLGRAWLVGEARALWAALGPLTARAHAHARPARPARPARAERERERERAALLDRAAIDHILTAVNAPGKKTKRRT